MTNLNSEREGEVPEDEMDPMDPVNPQENGGNGSIGNDDRSTGLSESYADQGSSRDLLVNFISIHKDFLETIMRNLPVVIYSARSDDQCTTIYVSDQIVELTGYSSQRFLEEPDIWVRIIHEDDRNRVLTEIEDRREQGEQFSLEYRIVTKSGEVKQVRDRNIPILDDQGRSIRLDGYMEDITSEVEQRREIENSEKRYRMLIENTQEGVWAFDENIRVTFANDALLEMLGYSLDEIIGKQGFMFADPDMISEAEEHIKKRKNGVQESFKFEFIKKDGNRLPVLISASPIIGDDGSFQGSILFIRDMSKEVEVQEALKATRSRFELAQKAVGIGNWDWDMTTDELFWSDQVEHIFAFEHRTFPGTFQAFMERVHPEDRENLMTAIEECVHYGKEYIMDHRILLEDGTIKYVLEMGNILRDWKGQPHRMVGIVKDISQMKEAEFEIKKLNKELKRQTKNLEAINEELKAFSYSVSHDLQSPLRHIDGFSALLEEYQDVLDEKGKDYLGWIRSNIKRMEELIESLLNLSRISNQSLIWEKFDMTELSKSIAERLKRSDPKREVEFKIHGGMVTWGDKNLVSILLTNLLENAWKFTSRMPNAEIEVGKMDLEGRTIFFIRDNGEGFDMQYAGKLFTPFQRLHPEKDFPGSGIGLSIVYRIINRHGGEIWANSEVGKGTSFFFTFDIGDS